MQRPSDQVLTAAQMRRAERALIDAGSSESELMELAGKGCAEWIWRIAAGRSVTVLCGPGNNGGDGYVIARVLEERGLAVQVIAPHPPTAEAARAAAAGFRGAIVQNAESARGDVLVDCLFGTGLTRILSGDHQQLLRSAAARHEYTIAVDLPSGAETDSGAMLGEELPHYDLTLALGAWKPAHFRQPACAHLGELRCVPIGIGSVAGAAQLIERPSIAAPPGDAHKYTRGLACVVAGAMPGAALLACQAAQRSGAGYVKLLGKIGNRRAAPSLVTAGGPLSDTLDDKRIGAVLIGPGLGRDDAARERLKTAIARADRLVLDADALHLLTPAMLRDGAHYLATPHDGELAALCRSFGTQGEDRTSRAIALAAASGMTVLAKGPDSVIAAPDGSVFIAEPATSWLSVAGSGDVLAGIALSRMANGRSPLDAACEAVWLHGEAARLSGPAFTADDLAAGVPSAMIAAS